MEKSVSQLLARGYFIGGSPCSGKSTVAGMLSDRYGLPYYPIDDYQQAHLDRCRPDRQPVMHKLATMDWETMWMRPVARQVAELFDFYRERFDMIVVDLAEMGWQRPFLVEGVALLPALLARYRVLPSRALFLIPTEDFQREHYEKRPWVDGILQSCSDPAQAFANWMQRDHQFGQEIARRAARHSYPVEIVDGSVTAATVAVQVARHFDLGSES